MGGLADIEFSDIAIEAEPASCRFKRFSEDLTVQVVPQALWPELQALRETLLAVDSVRFRIEFHGMRLRVQRRQTPYGPVFIARRIAQVLRRIDDIGLPGPILSALRDPRLRAGFVIFSGGPGSGKTTTACALLMDRLEKIGGFTWTAENPVEFDLQGPHGAGQCYQEEINEDGEVMRVLMDTLRSGADTFYIGEIREEQSAKAACLAAASGMLVVSTLHADNPQQAILKIGMLAGFDSIAQSLKAVVTLRLDNRMTANGPQKVLYVQPFFVEDEALRIKIREGNLASINSDIEMQRNRAVMGSAAGLSSTRGGILR
ncbi:ATPase, T2SS/T4P/T4SS family [Acidithiobacillus caldus]|jgi:Tfp pilus assembly pilus retraction ATPase PilT|uniref:Twitching motility protein PilT n=1 Tax=Acidithiobacillus caldus (strain ATCC 51756 / DSM 8584 / KU) TaxID=637389 RepID=A0A060A0P9_ACICK|nr:ATPase, T2SS/T4P/T4SS family [Acidithiobacillus caldus]AIA55727.1 Twitching motility protein PilT [Acidithiobacillus caldus ATCC 51756]AUW32516.1 pilus assembly protein PilU [Acidithiobacillus caldus]MBU2729598.1 Flp pilus assembly complex ATPase component TadA [Acidithiobacillus caldus]MBU2734261.1 Flp pilus assembly complex ATPase component TadA [Acidithiobacillus caldus ATCC 51756]MBU2746107.1 Flp pilus assembly complex ATPase component TadA [Acidithiobacillus caldus]